VTIVKIDNAQEGVYFVNGLLALIREMAAEMKRSDGSDEETLNHIERRAILRLKEETFNSRADPEETERLLNISQDAIRFALVLIRTNTTDGSLV
jgi:hypothetical protein